MLCALQVSFNRDHVDEDGTPSIRRVARTLFGQGNPFPLKKVMTFNRHTKDFFFNIDYGDVSFLPKNSQKYGHMYPSSSPVILKATFVSL